jgi:hypothetical protein
MTYKRNVTATLAAIIGTAVFLTGCSSLPASKSGEKKPAAKTAPSTTVKAAALRETPTSLPIISKYVNDVHLRPGVFTTACHASAGGWRASGTVKNAGHTAHAFTMTVYFTDSKATVLASGQNTVQVAAGDSGTWAVTAKFFAPAAVNCVLVGVG